MSWPVPLLGAVPVNAIACVILAGLGFLSPGIWLIGLGVELAFLFGLASMGRFQRLVDAEDAFHFRKSTELKLEALIADLVPPDKERLAEIEDRVMRVSDAYGRYSGDDPQAESNLKDLRKLSFFYLKLLLARRQISGVTQTDELRKITGEIKELEIEVSEETLSSSARRSKEATLELLKKRVAIAGKRETSLEEIDSDLRRIETQVELAVENAIIQANPSELTFQLDLSSRALDSADMTGYGSAFRSIEAEL